MKLFLDSNVFLRAIIRDDPERAKASLSVLEMVDRREIKACTSMLVLNEVLWVLEGLGVQREDIAKRILAIRNSRVEILPASNHDSVERAIEFYLVKNVDFQDALNSETAKSQGVTVVVSYDRHFDVIDLVERWEPSQILGLMARTDEVYG